MIRNVQEITDLITYFKINKYCESEICLVLTLKFPPNVADDFLRHNKYEEYKLKDLLNHLEKELEIPKQTQIAMLSMYADQSQTHYNSKQNFKEKNLQKKSPLINFSKRVNVKMKQPTGISHTNSSPCSNPNCRQISHTAVYCPEYSSAKKHKIAKKLSLCLICLKEDHKTNECLINYQCIQCGGKHNIIICSKTNLRYNNQVHDTNIERKSEVH